MRGSPRPDVSLLTGQACGHGRRQHALTYKPHVAEYLLVLLIRATAFRAAASTAHAGRAAWRPVPPQRAGHMQTRRDRSEGRRNRVTEYTGIHVHVPALVADFLPASQQSFSLEADPLRGHDGCRVPRLNIQLQSRNLQLMDRPQCKRLQRAGSCSAAAC